MWQVLMNRHCRVHVKSISKRHFSFNKSSLPMTTHVDNDYTFLPVFVFVFVLLGTCCDSIIISVTLLTNVWVIRCRNDDGRRYIEIISENLCCECEATKTRKTYHEFNSITHYNYTHTRQIKHQLDININHIRSVKLFKLIRKPHSFIIHWAHSFFKHL